MMTTLQFVCFLFGSVVATFRCSALLLPTTPSLNRHHHVPANKDESVVHTLILCRHGDSIWNGGEPGTQETFTGWTDVPLSLKGIQEAKNTGRQVADDYGFGIDACFTSILQRAQMTAHYCLWAVRFSEQPTGRFLAPRQYISDHRLNERHYGALQGLVKQDVQAGLYGHDPADVRLWRRSWYTVPPLLSENDPRRLEDLRKYVNYCGGDPAQVPRGESLEQVANDRIRPFLDQVVAPVLQEAALMKNNSNKNGGTGLVVAHANSLRALIGVICEVEKDPAALAKLEALRLQTGVPLVLKFRQRDDGSYQVCDLEGVACTNTSQYGVEPTTLTQPDLPVWPLSCIPNQQPPKQAPPTTTKARGEGRINIEELEEEPTIAPDVLFR